VIRTFAALAASAALVTALECLAASPIDLDVLANVEAVQREHPEHFAKIERILAEAPSRDVRLTNLVLTSLPPKKRLDFSLDGTWYTKVITLQVNPKVLLVTPSGRPLKGREAIQAYTQAARAGDCSAAKRLGQIYQNGEGGIARDGVEAAKWFNAARGLGCAVPLGVTKN
jgi:TPR repeat protein